MQELRRGVFEHELGLIFDGDELIERAFANEQSTRDKYLAYAEQADKEGYFGVGSLFRATASAEDVHAIAVSRVVGVRFDPANNPGVSNRLTGGRLTVTAETLGGQRLRASRVYSDCTRPPDTGGGGGGGGQVGGGGEG